MKYDLADYLKVPGPPIDYPAGRCIYQSPVAPALYLVVEGIVRVSRMFSAEISAHVRFYRAGDFFGESCLGERQGSSIEIAVAVKLTTVRACAPEVFFQQARRHPEIAFAMVQLQAARQQETLHRLAVANEYLVEQRLVEVLLQMGREIGEVREGDLYIPPVTHERIAEIVGTSREVVTTHMRLMRKRGLLRYRRNQPIVLVNSKLFQARRVGEAA